MKAKNALVFGASSQIALELCHELARGGTRLTMIARSAMRLEEIANDLRIRYGALVQWQPESDEALGQGLERLDAFDLVVVAYGVLEGPLATLIETNLTKVVLLLSQIVAQADSERPLSILVFSSIAADRPKERNLAYGAAKAGLDFYLAGVREQCRATKIKIITVKPGDTFSPMTRGRNLIFPSNATDVARSLIDRFPLSPGTVYSPRFWGPIMTAVRMMPRWLFRITERFRRI